MDPDQTRQRVAALIKQRGVNLKAVSQAIGRNDSYMQQYLKYGVPLHLPDRVRAALARYFGVDPRELGAPVVRPGHAELLLFPLHCQQCEADFSIAVGWLVARDSIACPRCGRPVDLKKLHRPIEELTRIAAELDEIADQPK